MIHSYAVSDGFEVLMFQRLSLTTIITFSCCLHTLYLSVILITGKLGNCWNGVEMKWGGGVSLQNSLYSLRRTYSVTHSIESVSIDFH